MSELAPVLKQRFFDADGDPLSGGLLYSYAAGTTTPLATYTNQGGLTANLNPVVLDANGEADVWLGDNPYKFVLTDSLGAVQWTVDNIDSFATQIAAISSAFQKVSVSYSQIQTAALSNAIQLFSLPAKAMLKNVVVKHRTLFTGTSISSVIAQIGPSGTYDMFVGSFDIKQAVADGAFDSNSANYIGSFASPTAIYLNAVAVGANLSSLSQGALDVWYEYMVLE